MNVELQFELLLKKVKQKFYLDLFPYNRNFVKRRILARMRALRIKTYIEYYKYLIDNRDELFNLLDALSIQVTEFFRDPDVFLYFRDRILPRIIITKKRRRQKLLRIWSAGCASGEEVYSIAMIVDDMISNEFIWRVYGTDIDREALEIAKDGIYPKNKLKNIENRYWKYLESIDGKYKVKERIKRRALFFYHNLLSDPYLRNFDVIFCRNVLIYFDICSQEKVVREFYESLNKGGYLILGKAEVMPYRLCNLFEEIDANRKIFKKL